MPTRSEILSTSLGNSKSNLRVPLSFILVDFKNGTELAGSRSVRTTTTGDWGSITVIGSTTMATNDYIEVKTKASAAATIQYASLSMSVLGVV